MFTVGDYSQQPRFCWPVEGQIQSVICRAAGYWTSILCNNSDYVCKFSYIRVCMVRTKCEPPDYFIHCCVSGFCLWDTGNQRIGPIQRNKPVLEILTCVLQWSFFQNLNILFMDTLTQQMVFLIVNINIFWGDLSGISAKTATLVSWSEAVEWKLRRSGTL